jgi:hypothetical protein
VVEFRLPLPPGFKGKIPDDIHSPEEVRALMVDMLTVDGLNTDAAVSLHRYY